MNPTNEENDAAVGGFPTVSRLAVASLVCGLLGFLSAGIIGVLGVVFGHLSMGRIKRSSGALEGRGLAIAGLVTGYGDGGQTIADNACRGRRLAAGLAPAIL
jgi:hypothetical protein